MKAPFSFLELLLPTQPHWGLLNSEHPQPSPALKPHQFWIPAGSQDLIILFCLSVGSSLSNSCCSRPVRFSLPHSWLVKINPLTTCNLHIHLLTFLEFFFLSGDQELCVYCPSGSPRARIPVSAVSLLGRSGRWAGAETTSWMPSLSVSSWWRSGAHTNATHPGASTSGRRSSLPGTTPGRILSALISFTTKSSVAFDLESTAVRRWVYWFILPKRQNCINASHIKKQEYKLSL